MAKKISYPHFLSHISTFWTSLSPKNQKKKSRLSGWMDGWMSVNTITLERNEISSSFLHHFVCFRNWKVEFEDEPDRSGPSGTRHTKILQKTGFLHFKAFYVTFSSFSQEHLLFCSSSRIKWHFQNFDLVNLIKSCNRLQNFKVNLHASRFWKLASFLCMQATCMQFRKEKRAKCVTIVKMGKVAKPRLI